MTTPDPAAHTTTPIPAAEAPEFSLEPWHPGRVPEAPPPPPRQAFPLLAALGLAALAYALSAGGLALNMLLWVTAFGGLCLWRLRQRGERPSPEGLTLLGVAGAFALLLTLREPPALLFILDVLALLLSLILGAAYLRFEGLGQSSVGRLVSVALSGSLRFSFGGLALLERFPWARLKPAGGHHLSRWGTGLVLTVPVVLLFGSLLMGADQGFSKLVSGLWQWPTHLANIDAWVGSFLEWGAWFAVAGGLIYSALVASKPGMLEHQAASGGKLGLVEMGLPLGSLSALFLIFLLLQLPYLLAGQLPQGLTYAEYIRQGFGELMLTAFLSLALLLLAYRLTQTQVRVTAAYKLLNLAVLLPLALILLSASQRWQLYTLAYGLSEIRVLGAAFLVWLVGCQSWLVALLWRGELQRFAYPALLWGLGVLSGLTLLNPAALIARTNLHRQDAAITNAQRRTPQQANWPELVELGPDAVPVLVNYWKALPPCQKKSPCAKERLFMLHTLQTRYTEKEAPDWRLWNLSVARARGLVQSLAPQELNEK